MSFFSSYVNYHTKRALYASIKEQQRLKARRDAFAQSFYSLRKEYDLGVKSTEAVQKQLVREIEKVSIDEEQLPVVYAHIEGAGLTKVLPVEYRPDFKRYAATADRSIRTHVSTQASVSDFLIILLVGSLSSYGLFSLADLMTNDALILKTVGSVIAIATAYLVFTTRPAVSRAPHISKDVLAQYTPEVSYLYIPALRERAEQADNIIPVDFSSHQYKTSLVGDWATKRV